MTLFFTWNQPSGLHIKTALLTGANRRSGVDISTILCMTFARVTCVTLSKHNGGDNSYLRDANMCCLHRYVLKTSHMLPIGNIHTGKSVRTGDLTLWKAGDTAIYFDIRFVFICRISRTIRHYVICVTFHNFSLSAWIDDVNAMVTLSYSVSMRIE